MFKKDNKKRECPKTQENTHKKWKIDKKRQRERTNMQKHTNLSNKKDKNFWKCRSVKYVFLTDRDNKKRKKRDNRWTNRWTKGGHKEVTHACKKWNVEEFFLYKREIVVHKEWVQEEGDQENKRSNIRGNEKRGEYETWWTKTRSDEKRDGRKTCKKEKHKKAFERDSVFFFFSNTEEFLKKKKDKKETKLTLKQSRKKGRSLHEENCMMLSDCKGQEQNIFKREK